MFNDPKSKFATDTANTAVAPVAPQKPATMTTYPKPANSGMVGSDYSVGRGVAGGGLPSAKPPAPAPMAPRPAAAGTRFGRSLNLAVDRSIQAQTALTNAGLGIAERGANLSLMPARRLAGFARDVSAGFSGSENPNEGKPFGMDVSLPRITRRLDGTQPYQRTSPRTRYVPVQAAAAAPAVAAGPAATMLENGARMPESALLPEKPKPPADGIYRGKDANGNNVYGGSQAELSAGMAKASAGFGTGTPESRQWLAGVQPLAGSPEAMPHAPVTAGVAAQAVTHNAGASPVVSGPGPLAAGAMAPSAGYTTQPQQPVGYPVQVQPEAIAVPQFRRVLPEDVPMTAVTGRQGTVIQSPSDSTANKLQRALTSYSVKGSPSTRAALARAILGEAGARQGERMQTLRMQDQAALNAQQANASAAEGNANRRLAADKFNVESQDTREHRRQLVDLEKSKPFQVGQGEDGGQGIVRADGSYTPITDASGEPVKFDTARQDVSPNALLKAYTDRMSAIESGLGTAEEKRAQRNALEADPMFAALRGQGTQPR